MSSFGERLKNIRIIKGMTQEQLAASCNTSSGLIRHLEKSRRKPGYDMLVLFCNVLNTSPAYLMQDDLTLQPSDDGEEVLQITNQLTPDNLKLLKDVMKTWVSHLNE